MTRRYGHWLFLLPIVAVFLALGVWQVQRLAWKRDLIARVTARVDAQPSAAPGPVDWPGIDARSTEYRHVRVTGVYETGKDTLTLALTDLGSGYWVLTPLRTDAGYTVLINRGFVPQDQRDHPAPPSTGVVTVQGLLRLSEPGGGFLRRNDPANGKWYSRDVAAISATSHLAGPVAPYFIDQDAGAEPNTWPRAGLTVINFPNNHLGYALTWFAMAVLTVVGGLIITSKSASPSPP